MKYSIPLLFGHRGIGDPWTVRLGIPEESIPAIQYAAKHHAYAVEGDVQVSGPEEDESRTMYMMHDDHLDRTTDGEGGSNAKPWSYIKDLHLEIPVDKNSNNDYDNTKFSPPSFRKWLEAAKETGKKVFAELKGPWTEPQIAKYAEELVRQGMVDRVITASGETRLTTFAKYIPTGARSWSANHIPPIYLVKRITNSGYVTMSLPVVEDNQKYVEGLQEAGIKVLVYTLDGASHYKRAQRLGVYGWFCDNIDDAYKWLQEVA